MRTKNSAKNGYVSDDDNVRYKLNANYFNSTSRKPDKVVEKARNAKTDDQNVRYMFPVGPVKKQEPKVKSKSKIKVNFWSNKHNATRIQKGELKQKEVNRRHTIASSLKDFHKPNPLAVKVRKRVSFLPTPIFSDNHVPMVTVPDDLTINLNEEEAHDLRDDLNTAYLNHELDHNSSKARLHKSKSAGSTTHTSPKGYKRKNVHFQVNDNEHELEYFSKYVVQKLRKMHTDQRIYSENLINIVLMFGQFGKLNGKTKILDV